MVYVRSSSGSGDGKTVDGMASLLSLLRFALRSLIRGGAIPYEINQELQTHLDEQTEELMRAGWARRDARDEAVRRFGDLERIRRECLQLSMARQRGGTMDVAEDVRVALRGFRRSPFFAVTSVLIVGLGIGATTTIFSVADHVLLRPLPYPDPGALVTVGKPGSGMSIPDFLELRDRVGAFSAVGAQWDREYDLTSSGDPERVNVGQVTAGFLSTLGGRPALGRLFGEGDFEPSVQRTAILSQEIWRRRWNGQKTAIGTTVRLDGLEYQVIGVLSSDFVDPEALVQNKVDIWVPLDPPDPLREARTSSILRVVARLGQSGTTTRAEEELHALSLALASAFPESSRRTDGSPIPFRLRSLREATVGGVGRKLFLLLGAVGLMLLIACANLANLTLARGADRAQELALRSALGATRGRLVRFLLTESLLLALLGGLLGIGLSVPGVEAFKALGAGGLPRLASVTVDWGVMAFAVALSGVTGVLVGLLPAVRSGVADLTSTFREGSSTVTLSSRRIALREGLMIAQIALALVLLVGAGLLFNSLLHLRAVDPGFDTRNLVTTEIRFGLPFGWGETRYRSPQSKARFTEELLPALRDLPGVERVGGALSLPFARDHYFGGTVAREDNPGDTIDAWIRPVTYGFLETLGARVLAGRTFNEQEDRQGTGDGDFGTPGQRPPQTLPVLVNRTLAHRLWADGSPLGRGLVLGQTRAQVIGVIEDVSHLGLDQPREANIYVPYVRVGTRFDRLDLVLRYRGSSAGLAQGIRGAVRAIDPDLPVGELVTMDERMSRTMVTPRFYSALFAAFAIFALVLAASGIYASMTYLVSRRMREFGIRLALGCPPRAVLVKVLGRGAALAAAGIFLGLGGSLAMSRLLRAYLFGLKPTDLATFVCVSVLLATAAVFSCSAPARRAAQANPVDVLRGE